MGDRGAICFEKDFSALDKCNSSLNLHENHLMQWAKTNNSLLTTLIEKQF
jgi:hypothetical protein